VAVLHVNPREVEEELMAHRESCWRAAVGDFADEEYGEEIKAF
jgi:hypothetical protein